MPHRLTCAECKGAFVPKRPQFCSKKCGNRARQRKFQAKKPKKPKAWALYPDGIPATKIDTSAIKLEGDDSKPS